MSIGRCTARWVAMRETFAIGVLPSLNDLVGVLSCPRPLPGTPRAAKRFLRHLARPPTRGYWTRRAGR